jgi:hypothetical protein
VACDGAEMPLEALLQKEGAHYNVHQAWQAKRHFVMCTCGQASAHYNVGTWTVPGAAWCVDGGPRCANGSGTAEAAAAAP